MTPSPRESRVAGWAHHLPAGVRPYLEAAPLAAACLGVSSGFGFAMIAATLTTRLSQYGIRKSAVTAFALTFLAYNIKFLWAPMVDHVRLPFLWRFGQRRSWLWLVGTLLMAAVFYLGSLDPATSLPQVATAAVLVGIAGATYDIVIDSYRIELLETSQLGVGSGMAQYGWRIGATGAGALALVVATRFGWAAAYAACAIFALPAMVTGLVMGEPTSRPAGPPIRGLAEAVTAYFRPLLEFLQRPGALLVLAFVVVHKIGDTLANLTLRLFYADLGFTNDELALYEVGAGFFALLAGIFVGGVIYSAIGLKQSVFASLVLMAISNLGFAMLAAAGHSNVGLLAVTVVETFTSGIGGVTVGAYLAALCNLRYTATQFALLSALASVAGRFLTGTAAGGLIEALGFANFYLFTTLIALPGVALFALMTRKGLADVLVVTHEA